MSVSGGEGGGKNNIRVQDPELMFTKNLITHILSL